MAFLLDTNVVSELRKSTPDRHVLAWHRRHADQDAYISVLTVGEIRKGIERVRSRDRGHAETLEGWLAGVLSAYRRRILPITVDITEAWGRMASSGQPMPVVDGLLAATAKLHRLTLVTRNLADVADAGIPVVNPFDPKRSAGRGGP